MNRTKNLAKKVGFVLGTALLGALTGSTTYAAEISVGVTIHAESDFYEPLTPHGNWVVIGSYGRCWRPGHVEAGWRPYCNGSWQRTDGGWYWVSDEPWGWATYHYGRWDFDAEFGWYWVPQIVWGPSWVSWHEGGGYIGWAPLSPHGRIDVRVNSPRVVFVEERRFLEPVRHKTVIVNNTTIINKTVINEGPRTEVIEKVTGHKIQPVQVRELRRKEEGAVVVKHEAKPETKREAKSEAVQSPKHDAKPEVKRNEAKPEIVRPSKPETKPEIKREAKSEAAQPSKHEAKTEVKRAAKPDTKREAKPDSKPDSKPEDKPEGKSEGEKHDQKQK